MTNYNNGKIYKIIVNNTDEEYDPYIGSTTKKYLSQRMTSHKGDYKRYNNGKQNHKMASFTLFDKYGIENCEIVLIENFPCNSKDELRSRERYHYDNIKNCNNYRPIRNEADSKDICAKKYRRRLELNPNHNNEDYKKRKEHRNAKYICLCSGHYTLINRTQHEKTKKHINYLSSLENINPQI